jgi:hypothetical protein
MLCMHTRSVPSRKQYVNPEKLTARSFRHGHGVGFCCIGEPGHLHEALM